MEWQPMECCGHHRDVLRYEKECWLCERDKLRAEVERLEAVVEAARVDAEQESMARVKYQIENAKLRAVVEAGRAVTACVLAEEGEWNDDIALLFELATEHKAKLDALEETP